METSFYATTSVEFCVAAKAASIEFCKGFVAQGLNGSKDDMAGYNRKALYFLRRALMLQDVIDVYFSPKTENKVVIDYTPKKAVIDEPWFDCQPSLQETDEEDAVETSHQEYSYTSSGKCQSKSKSKWNRCGKTTRVLSNR